jgi:hypothetical protein
MSEVPLHEQNAAAILQNLIKPVVFLKICKLKGKVYADLGMQPRHKSA